MFLKFSVITFDIKNNLGVMCICCRFSESKCQHDFILHLFSFQDIKKHRKETKGKKMTQRKRMKKSEKKKNTKWKRKVKKRKDEEDNEEESE